MELRRRRLLPFILQRFSANFVPTATSAKIAPASWDDGVYRPDLNRAHLTTTQSCGSTNSNSSAVSVLNEVCDGVAIAAAVEAKAFDIIDLACENDENTFVFCGSLAARIAALGIELTASGWVSLTLFAIGALLFIVCGKL